ncbi:MAG: glycine zipper 2TM domain-containing protein [Betaproteobacteria bacterium]|nr:glycine zipper 2TM domain-containing protein [Betaproteobacteria bacterium]
MRLPPFAAVGVGGYKVLSKPTHADVIAIKEIKETVRTPREECTEVQVRQQAPVQDQHRVAGTVAGGVLGGVLGSMVGGGTGKTLATVGGAAAGPSRKHSAGATCKRMMPTWSRKPGAKLSM